MMSKLCGILLDFPKSFNTTRTIQIGLKVLDYPGMYTAASEPFTLSDIFGILGVIIALTHGCHKLKTNQLVILAPISFSGLTLVS